MKKFIIVVSTLLASLNIYADVDAIACRGKILPEYKIARLAASTPNGTLAIVKTLDVEKSQKVEKGQVIATLVGIDKAKLDLAVAKANLEKAELSAKLNILKQGQNLADLQGTYEQNKKMLAKGPSARERTQMEYEQETLVRHMKFAGEVLEALKLTEEANVKEAKLAIEQAQLNYDDFSVKAPIAGTIIEIYSKIGEALSQDGLCELANTDSMYVEAEVYESDLNKIKLGDKAECISHALENKALSGKVVEISNYVKTNHIFSNNPSDFTNSKVVLVKIALDKPEAVRNLISSQVSVRILLAK
ncbi:MAG: efflux RND transporter periplasmic adaptor subunit [Opitutales bacterium]